MCKGEQISRPMGRPWSLPMAMSSRQQRTSCSRLLKTSGPMNPATSLTWSQAPLGCTFASSAPTALLKPYFRDSSTIMSTPLAAPLVNSEPWPVSKYSPYRSPFFEFAYFRIFSTVTSNVLLQSSVPARLWNIVATVPGYPSLTSAWTSMWDSTHQGIVSCSLKVSTTSLSAVSTAATLPTMLSTGLVPMTM